MCVTDVVIATQPFVRTERLPFNGSKRGLVDVVSWNVPPWREARLVENQRPLGIGYNPVTIADYDPTGGLPDVDAMVTVRGVTHDSFVFFVKCVHGWPGKGHPSLQFARVVRQVDMLPRSSRRALLARSYDIPRSEPKFVVLGRVLGKF